VLRMSQSQSSDAGSGQQVLECAHIKVLYRTKKLTNELRNEYRVDTNKNECILTQL
jgi:hypothetical protein